MKNDVIEQDFLNVEKQIQNEEQTSQSRKDRIDQFPLLSIDELVGILGLTIKEDRINKILTFLCCLSAFTENSQLNVSYNAFSSTGKSYIPSEMAFLFPKGDVHKIGYTSPTAFFHDHGKFIKEQEGYLVDLERKILIFLDQPHNLLLQHLRPLLSHDQKEIQVKITDKNQRFGLRTKNVILRGFPAVIFCTAGLQIDEQEATRFLLLSPETTQEKIHRGIKEVLKKETDSESYQSELNNNPQRRLLIERIEAIKEERIKDIRINNQNEIEKRFFERHLKLKPRHQRDIKRLISIIKSIALLNLWHRHNDGNTIFTTDEDIEAGFKIWEDVSLSQELNLPPCVHQIFWEVIFPLYKEKQKGLHRKDILREHLKVYGRPIAEHQLKRGIIPLLEMAGLIIQEEDENDRRNKLIVPVTPPSGLHCLEEDNVDKGVG